MKFINAKFFYNNTELINKDIYSYWWVLMGELKTYGKDLEKTDDADKTSGEWDKLKSEEKSYNIVNSHSVELKNAYICGIADAIVPEIGEDPETIGGVVLTAGGNKGNSIIPFTVGQDYSGVGHNADSLWLLALDIGLGNDINEVQKKLFPFKIDGEANRATQKYNKAEYDISDNGRCIPLIGYTVTSDNAVNSVNFSGFTVGSSVITLSGLYSEQQQ